MSENGERRKRKRKAERRKESAELDAALGTIRKSLNTTLKHPDEAGALAPDSLAGAFEKVGKQYVEAVEKGKGKTRRERVKPVKCEPDRASSSTS